MQEVSGMGTVVVLWIDFATTEVRQTNIIRGLAKIFCTQTQCDMPISSLRMVIQFVLTLSSYIL